ncbi:unnamed protein product, partial [Symbiodinium necroappetens]
MWPKESIALLAPRAALLCEGSAFKKVSSLPADKLKSSDDSGVKLLVATLGGSWGRTDVEVKYDTFERAIFGTVQKSDETNDSYLARHDIHFEELLALGVTLPEIRAYILLRQSSLSSEDRKKIVVEMGGALDFKKVCASIRLLGSRFFADLQGQKGTYKTKTYDAHMVEDAGPEDTERAYQASASAAPPAPVEEPEGDLDAEYVEAMVAAEDQDALQIQAFEEELEGFFQDTPELQEALVSYLEARSRLLAKRKARGFWPIASGQKRAKGSKGFKGKGKGKNACEQLLLRISKSNCRICGERGHWKAECPKLGRGGAKNEATTTVAEVTGSATGEHLDDEIHTQLPAEAVSLAEDDRWDMVATPSAVLHVEGQVNVLSDRMTKVPWHEIQLTGRFSPELSNLLSPNTPLPPSPSHAMRSLDRQAARSQSGNRTLMVAFALQELSETSLCSELPVLDNTHRPDLVPVESPLRQQLQSVGQLKESTFVPAMRVISRLPENSENCKADRSEHPKPLLSSPAKGNVSEYQCLGFEDRTTMHHDRQRLRIAPVKTLLTIFAQTHPQEQPASADPPSLEGWGPPPIPLHGPSYRSLSNEDKIRLRKIHANLGHPAPESLARHLRAAKESQMMIDAALDYQPAVFSKLDGLTVVKVLGYFQGLNTKTYVTTAAWQRGRLERHGDILKDMLSRIDLESPIINDVTFDQVLQQAILAKNSLVRHSGFAPEQIVFGKSLRLPGSILSDEDLTAHALAEGADLESEAFRQKLDIRCKARRAFLEADNSQAIRQATLRRSNPVRGPFEAGMWVLYWVKKSSPNRLAAGQLPCVSGNTSRILPWESPPGKMLEVIPQYWSLRFQRLPLIILRLKEVAEVERESPVDTAAPSAPADVTGEMYASPVGNEVPPQDVPIPDSDEGLISEQVYLACHETGLHDEKGDELITFTHVETSEDFVGPPLAEDGLPFVSEPLCPDAHQAFCLEVPVKSKDIKKWLIESAPEQLVTLAAAGKRSRAEVSIKNLTKAEIALFVLKSRWILTWKAPEDSRTPNLLKFYGMHLRFHVKDSYVRNIPSIDVGEVQGAITRATVATLLLANKVLREAQEFGNVGITYLPIEVDRLTFVSFGDASFASSKCLSSHQGALICATDDRLLANKEAPLSPLTWSSKKIPRVVRSTLSAEAYAMSKAVDMLGWMRWVPTTLQAADCLTKPMDASVLRTILAQ